VEQGVRERLLAVEAGREKWLVKRLVKMASDAQNGWQIGW
jgi:hypothetical protein